MNDFEKSRDVISYLYAILSTQRQRMIDLSRDMGYWANITLGDLCRYSADPAVWTKIAVLVLAVGATRLYFGQSVPTAIGFQWPAPEVRLMPEIS